MKNSDVHELLVDGVVYRLEEFEDKMIVCKNNINVIKIQISSVERDICMLTGGKGWCPDPVHHKYIARKWTKDLANTHPEYSKDIQNFPSQFN
jgi:hypothetical protein